MNIPKNTLDNWQIIVLELKEAFDRSGMTQLDLQMKTGLDQSNISRIFAMKFTPRISTLTLIADALGVRIKVIDEKKTG